MNALVTTEKGQDLKVQVNIKSFLILETEASYGSLSKEDATVFELTTKTWSLIAI